MDAGAIVEVSLGILGRIAEGISQAVAAAKRSEDEAFAILEKALTDGADGVVSMRAKLKANKQAALDALAAKFPTDG